MKHYQTTDVGPQRICAGLHTETMAAARATLKRFNGGLPPNLHMANRGVLLGVIKELHRELLELRAAKP